MAYLREKIAILLLVSLSLVPEAALAWHRAHETGDPTAGHGQAAAPAVQPAQSFSPGIRNVRPAPGLQNLRPVPTLAPIQPVPPFQPPVPIPTFQPLPTVPPDLNLPPYFCPWWAWWCDRPPQPQPRGQQVAIGDSLALGLVARDGYARRYNQLLEQSLGYPVGLTNLGRIGLKSGELSQLVQADPQLRTSLSQADYITWNIGGADLLEARRLYQAQACGGADNQACLRQTNAALKANWSQSVSAITNLKKSPQVRVATMDIYYPYVAEDNQRDSWPGDRGNDFQILKPYLDDINTHLRTTAQSAGMKVAPVYHLFNGPTGTEDPRAKGYMSVDGFHPNDAGHAVVAQALFH
jgi:lysophospholipase L1-like esterase